GQIPLAWSSSELSSRSSKLRGWEKSHLHLKQRHSSSRGQKQIHGSSLISGSIVSSYGRLLRQQGSRGQGKEESQLGNEVIPGCGKGVKKRWGRGKNSGTQVPGGILFLWRVQKG